MDEAVCPGMGSSAVETTAERPKTGGAGDEPRSLGADAGRGGELSERDGRARAVYVRSMAGFLDALFAPSGDRAQ